MINAWLTTIKNVTVCRPDMNPWGGGGGVTSTNNKRGCALLTNKSSTQSGNHKC